jgi:outer membrane protein TolC
LSLDEALKLGEQQRSAGSDVRTRYWALVQAIRATQLAATTLAMSKQVMRLATDPSRALPRIDALAARAEAARNAMGQLVAEARRRDAEVALKSLILADAGDPRWQATLLPADRVEFPATTAREMAEEQVREVQRLFDAGEASMFELVRAQRDLSDAKDTEARALLEYRKAQVELERLQQTR